MSDPTPSGDAPNDPAPEAPQPEAAPEPTHPQPTIQVPQYPYLSPSAQYPVVQAPAFAPKNGMGLTALVLGIAGAALALIPYIGCIGAIAGVIAIVFGAIGIANANGGKATNRTSAIAGLSLGIAALLLGVLVNFVTYTASSSVETDAGEITGASDGAAPSDADPAEAAETASEEPPEPAGIGDGQWKVGEEIEPGTYVTWAEDGFMGCYVARLSGFSGEFDDIIANTNLSSDARGRITVAEDDAGVEFSGGCEWLPATEATLAATEGEVGPGVWEVGTEVPPGTYVTEAEGDGILDSCYVARLAGFGMDFDEIIANDNIDGGSQGRIEIADSDAGVEFSGECTWRLE
ncbi:DUF308 domain-containing protein [Glycomyces rhizosphaerae]|uniref:DUF308 domain-containing protein n=1 Tax=Glycomyces rhizosphaerae TaxID=2054422 RepID=A0ABV7Q601_9ACTN